MSGAVARPTAIGAIDVGGTKVALGLVLPDGRVAARDSLPTEALRSEGRGPEAAVDALAGLAARASHGLIGVGVAATGRPRGSVLGGLEELLPAWDGRDIAAIVAERLSLGCTVENDADAVALAEHRRGAAAGAEPLVYVTVSTGIGIGVIVRGELLRGRDGAHPEFGHHVIGGDGPTCRCGSPCLERRASGRAVEDEWYRRTGRREGAASVVRAADADDPTATEVLSSAFRDLAVGLANLAGAFAPEALVIGGGLGTAFGRILPALEEELAHRRFVPPVRILPTSFSTDAGLVGAATVWADAA